MPFSYYARLSPRNQALYRASDRVAEVPLPRPADLVPLGEVLRRALAREDRRAVAAAARSLSDALLDQLQVTPLAVKVLAVRPSSRWGELHGLYTASEAAPAEIRLWMRTAQHKQVVAFRTFLRTLLHELGHHLDYRHLKLRDSYHTEGFFRRESSLFRQIVPAGEETAIPVRRTKGRVAEPNTATPPRPLRPRKAQPSLVSQRRPQSASRQTRDNGPRESSGPRETPEPAQGWLSFDHANGATDADDE